MTNTDTKKRPKLPYKILCVDDEDSTLQALRHLFNYFGYQVIVARSGEEALSILESHLDLNVIISDERFKPDQMKGSQFLKQSRELCPDAVRILLTAFSDAAELEEAVNEAEIFRGVSKPWSNKALALIVKEGIMRQQEARKQQKRTETLTKRGQHFHQVSQELAKKSRKQEEQINQLLEDQRRVREIRGEYEKQRDTLIDLLEIYDRKMASHSRRVAKWCRIMAEVVPGLCKTKFQKVSFQMAGLLHDVGKIGLEKELLAISIESLSQKDLQERQRHAVLGQRILRKLDAFQDIRVVIRHHHEQYDGSGFPEGLAKGQIPPWSRWIALANDYDNLRNTELYGERFDRPNAREQLKSWKGQRYGSDSVDRFIDEVLIPHALEEEEEAWIEEVNFRGLKVGMTLARDLYTINDQLVLSAGKIITPGIRQKLEDEYEDQNNHLIDIFVDVREKN